MNDSECCCPICPLIGKRLDEEFRLEWDIKNNQLINKFCYSDNLDPIIYASLLEIILDVRKEVEFQEGISATSTRGNVLYQVELKTRMFYQNYKKYTKSMTKNTSIVYEYFNIHVEPVE